MEYEDLKKRLSPLNELMMPIETMQNIEHVIREAAQVYRQKQSVPARGNMRNRIGSVSAVAAAVIAAAGIIVITETRQPANTSTTSTATNSATSHVATAPSTVPIQYTQAQLEKVQTTAKDVGVTAWIPTQSLPGDELTIVKSGKTELILDYKRIWLIESTQAIAKPYQITRQQKVDVGGKPATFIVSGDNTFLAFQKGATYILMENFITDQAISLTNMKRIAESFQPD